MIALDSYEILLKSGPREIVIDPNQFSFRLKSSIWEILPKGTFAIKDVSGTIQEFLLTVPGTPLTITYGKKDSRDNKTLPFVVDKDYLTDVPNKSVLGGDVEVTLIHEWFSKQEVSTEGYNNTPSEVIKTLIASYFPNTDIDSSDNDNLWYRMGMLQKDFIEEVLLPRAVSSSSQNTPFFAYINSNNIFNFKHYYNIYKAKPIIDLEYRELPPDKVTDTTIMDIAKTRRRFTKNFYDNKKSIFNINTNTGELEEQEDGILQYPSNQGGSYLPMVKLNNTTSIEFYDKVYDENDFLGKRIFSNRDAVSQDRFILIEAYDPRYDVGKTINLLVYTYDQEETLPNSISQYSGKYLIEECEDIWDGLNAQQAITKLTVSRKFANYGNDYSLKEGLLK